MIELPWLEKMLSLADEIDESTANTLLPDWVEGDTLIGPMPSAAQTTMKAMLRLRIIAKGLTEQHHACHHDAMAIEHDCKAFQKTIDQMRNDTMKLAALMWGEVCDALDPTSREKRLVIRKHFLIVERMPTEVEILSETLKEFVCSISSIDPADVMLSHVRGPVN
jgi:hypothetical protein